jgi:hypothetical protein
MTSRPHLQAFSLRQFTLLAIKAPKVRRTKKLCRRDLQDVVGAIAQCFRVTTRNVYRLLESDWKIEPQKDDSSRFKIGLIHLDDSVALDLRELSLKKSKPDSIFKSKEFTT